MYNVISLRRTAPKSQLYRSASATIFSGLVTAIQKASYPRSAHCVWTGQTLSENQRAMFL